jgi:hypothetical protein
MEEQLADVNVPEGGQAGTEDDCPFFFYWSCFPAQTKKTTGTEAVTDGAASLFGEGMMDEISDSEDSEDQEFDDGEWRRKSFFLFFFFFFYHPVRSRRRGGRSRRPTV